MAAGVPGNRSAVPGDPTRDRPDHDRAAGLPSGSDPVDVLAIARTVAAAVGRISGVVGLSPGPLGVAATYGPGGPVRGVAVRPRPGGGVEVSLHVTAYHDPTSYLPEVAERVRRAVWRAVEARYAAGVARIDVTIDDLILEGEDEADGA